MPRARLPHPCGDDSTDWGRRSGVGGRRLCGVCGTLERMDDTTPRSPTPDPRPLTTLEPVDAVHITTLIDNYSDSLMRDEGPAKRVGAMAGRRLPSIPAPTFEDGTTTAALIAE